MSLPRNVNYELNETAGHRSRMATLKKEAKLNDTVCKNVLNACKLTGAQTDIVLVGKKKKYSKLCSENSHHGGGGGKRRKRSLRSRRSSRRSKRRSGSRRR